MTRLVESLINFLSLCVRVVNCRNSLLLLLSSSDDEYDLHSSRIYLILPSVIGTNRRRPPAPSFCVVLNLLATWRRSQLTMFDVLVDSMIDGLKRAEWEKKETEKGDLAVLYVRACVPCYWEADNRRVCISVEKKKKVGRAFQGRDYYQHHPAREKVIVVLIILDWYGDYESIWSIIFWCSLWTLLWFWFDLWWFEKWLWHRLLRWFTTETNRYFWSSSRDSMTTIFSFATRIWLSFDSIHCCSNGWTYFTCGRSTCSQNILFPCWTCWYIVECIVRLAWSTWICFFILILILLYVIYLDFSSSFVITSCENNQSKL